MCAARHGRADRIIDRPVADRSGSHARTGWWRAVGDGEAGAGTAVRMVVVQHGHRADRRRRRFHLRWRVPQRKRRFAMRQYGDGAARARSDPLPVLRTSGRRALGRKGGLDGVIGIG